MPENVTPDPVANHLARFTPTSTGIDRDALLFAAGRASARPARGWRSWRTVAGLLALSQTATLAAWFASTPPAPLPSPVAPDRDVVGPSLPADPPVLAPTYTPEPMDPSSYGALVRRWEADDLPPPPSAAGVPGPARPVLSVAAGHSTWILE
ncbi:hypothetical protein [Fimbriiglobus ruber]|uniref:hypothetical protein n=1 Tax=Fimbriiglobus ruber TaxID=1908690 RepID=UPI000B4B2BBE|nr:hypothetical protein [Fimbriiglobus ruber]